VFFSHKERAREIMQTCYNLEQVKAADPVVFALNNRLRGITSDIKEVRFHLEKNTAGQH